MLKWVKLVSLEIDKLVADNIMGGEWRTARINDQWYTSVYGNKVDLIEEKDYYEYSTNIEDAWRVVEEMRKHREYDYSFLLEWSAENRWCCQFGDYIVETVMTAPEAICLAALKAKDIPYE